jgi:hypothetical protein
MEQLTVFYMPLSAPVWASMVGSAMEHAVIIEAPREMSISGYFMELVESFCRDRHRGQRWQDVHDGRPYYDEETNAHWFRLRDLTQHLEREGFRHWGRNKIGKELKQIGGQGGRNIEGRFVNMFYIDDDAFEPDAEVTTPEPPREPL